MDAEVVNPRLPMASYTLQCHLGCGQTIPWVPGNGAVGLSVWEMCCCKWKQGRISPAFPYSAFPSIHPRRSIWGRLGCTIIAGEEIIHELHSCFRLLRVKLLTECQPSRWQAQKNKNKPADVFPKWTTRNNCSYTLGWEVLCSLREWGPDVMSQGQERPASPLNRKTMWCSIR